MRSGMWASGQNRRVRGCAAVAAAILLMTTGCISVDLLGTGGESPLVESVVRGTAGPKIVLVEIDGVIGGSELVDSIFGAPPISMVARVRETLDRAREDKDVRALLIRIDSPGGTATASEQIYTEIKRFREERGVPVIAQMGTTAASGGYMIAMAADTVQAHPTTVTGSIGVIFTSMNFAGLMEKIGVEDQTITAGEFKDMGSPYRKLRSAERAQLQSIVNDMHARFRSIVDEGRPALSSEQVSELANGRIYSAQGALEVGLVDQLGTIEEAVVAIEDRLGVGSSRVVSYHRSRETRRNLYTRTYSDGGLFRSGAGAMSGAESMLGGRGDALALRSLDRILGRPGFHYLWWPGLMGAAAGN
ncbi:MAG: signal peptide peptidase SppA [Myxococcota bacterium]